MSNNIIFESISEEEIFDIVNEGFPLYMSLDETYLNENAVTNIINGLKERFYKLTKYNLTIEDLYNSKKMQSVIEKIDIKKDNAKVQKRAYIILIECLIMLFGAYPISNAFGKAAAKDLHKAAAKDVIAKSMGDNSTNNIPKTIVKYIALYLGFLSIPYIQATMNKSDCQRITILCDKQINKLYKLRNSDKNVGNAELKKEIDKKISELKETKKLIKEEEKKQVKAKNKQLIE